MATIKPIKERPLLLRGDLVQDIYAGRKTQTRRPVKRALFHRMTDEANVFGEGFISTNDCPYGIPGDRLWVRETWCKAYDDVFYRADGDPKFTDGTPYSGLIGKWLPSIHMPRWASRLTLEIVSVKIQRLLDISEADARAEGKDPIHKGVVATIETTNLATKETQRIVHENKEGRTARQRFLDSWDKIYAAKGFGRNENPWVWVIEFKRI
jgi:hypothetical protein